MTNPSRPGQTSFWEDYAKLKDVAATYVQGVREGRWATPGQRSTDSASYDPINETAQKTADVLKAVKPTFGTDWDTQGFKQSVSEGRPVLATAQLANATLGAGLDVIDPGLGHAVTTAISPFLLATAKRTGKLDPEFKAAMDLRRQYAGQSARTHPADWSYQLGPNAPAMDPVKPFDVNQLKEGDTIHALVGDRARVSAPLVEVQGQRLPAAVSAEGGADYTRTPEGGVWASNFGVIPRIQKQAREATAAGGGTPWAMTSAMGPTAINYSHHTWEPLLWQMHNAPAGSEARKLFDEEFAAKHPGWPGVDNTEEALHFLQSERTTARAPFVEQLQRKDYQKAGFPEPGPVRWAMTEPDLRGVETGASGYGVAKLDPQGKPIPDPGHTDYGTGLPGVYAGRLNTLLPYTEIWKDWAKRPDVASLLVRPKDASRALAKFRFDLPVQQVDQQLIDFMGRRLERPGG